MSDKSQVDKFCKAAAKIIPSDRTDQSQSPICKRERNPPSPFKTILFHKTFDNPLGQLEIHNNLNHGVT